MIQSEMSVINLWVCNILIGLTTPLKEDQKILAFVRLHNPIRDKIPKGVEACNIFIGQ